MNDTKKTITKSAPLLVQMSIYALVLLVSQLISSLLPPQIPVPSTVIGLILLYVLLSTHIIKVEWVDSFGSFLTSMIGFMFVPSGISLAANLDILKTEGLQLFLVIGLSTVVMLVVVTYVTHLIFTMKEFSWSSLKNSLFFGVPVKQEVKK